MGKKGNNKIMKPIVDKKIEETNLGGFNINTPSRYFKKDGTKYPNGMEGLLAWAKDFEDPTYKIVDRTHLWWGGKVSTIWLGLNHNHFDFDDKNPLIFETMVFTPGWYDLIIRDFPNCMDMARYQTLEEAKAGHVEMAKRWGNLFWVIKRRISTKWEQIKWRREFLRQQEKDQHDEKT